MDNSNNNQNINNTQLFGLSAFPANQPRQYDPNIRLWVESLVDQKYRPTRYIQKYKELSMQNPNLYPPLTPETENQILKNLPDVPDIVAEFEIARVYNKLEIEVYEFAVSQIPVDKRTELEKITSGVPEGALASEDIILKVRQLIITYVPNIDQLMQVYREGVAKQYIAGRF